MAKNAALEGSLGTMHALLALVMTSQLKETGSVAQYDAEGEMLTDEEGKPLTTQQFLATPQLMAVVTKFLKDNEITATAEQSVEVANLADEVAERRAANKERNAKIKAQRDDAMKVIRDAAAAKQ